MVSSSEHVRSRVRPAAARAMAKAGGRRRVRADEPTRGPPAALPLLGVLERMWLRLPVRLLRARNNVLDLAFYDVGTLPPATRTELLGWSDPDGSVLVVHPLAARGRPVEHFEHVDAFVESAIARRIDVVVVAGVGSSALGTAALAANVADALGRPVAGVVSGYGLADVIGEALTGWFVLRTANRVRQIVDLWLAPWQPFVARISEATQPNADPWRLVSYVRGLPESDTLAALLAEDRLPLAILVGHSKGNLSIAEAVSAGTVRRPLRVVTFGALVQLPAAGVSARQFLGMMDGFGLMNSLLPQLATPVPWAMHSCNTRAPFPLHVQAELADSGIAAPAFAVARPSRPTCAPDWAELATGAATAFLAAMNEGLRSIEQAMTLAGSAPRETTGAA